MDWCEKVHAINDGWINVHSCRCIIKQLPSVLEKGVCKHHAPIVNDMIHQISHVDNIVLSSTLIVSFNHISRLQSSPHLASYVWPGGDHHLNFPWNSLDTRFQPPDSRNPFGGNLLKNLLTQSSSAGTNFAYLAGTITYTYTRTGWSGSTISRIAYAFTTESGERDWCVWWFVCSARSWWLRWCTVHLCLWFRYVRVAEYP